MIEGPTVVPPFNYSVIDQIGLGLGHKALAVITDRGRIDGILAVVVIDDFEGALSLQGVLGARDVPYMIAVTALGVCAQIRRLVEKFGDVIEPDRLVLWDIEFSAKTIAQITDAALRFSIG